MQINFGFGPGFVTPEMAQEQMRQQQEQFKKMVEEKRCVVCQNTFMVHTANDQILFCNKTKEPVDDGSWGTYCEEWMAPEIQ